MTQDYQKKYADPTANTYYTSLNLSRGLFFLDKTTELTDQFFATEYGKSSTFSLFHSIGTAFLFPLAHAAILLISSTASLYHSYRLDRKRIKESEEFASRPFRARYQDTLIALVGFIVNVSIFVGSMVAAALIINPITLAGVVTALACGAVIYEIVTELLMRRTRNATIRNLDTRNAEIAMELEELNDKISQINAVLGNVAQDHELIDTTDGLYQRASELSREYNLNKVKIKLNQNANRAQNYYFATIGVTVIAIGLGLLVAFFPPASIAALAIGLTAGALVLGVGASRAAITYVKKKQNARAAMLQVEIENAFDVHDQDVQEHVVVLQPEHVALNELATKVYDHYKNLKHIYISYGRELKIDLDLKSITTDTKGVLEHYQREIKRYKLGEQAFQGNDDSVEAIEEELESIHEMLDEQLTALYAKHGATLKDAACSAMKRELNQEQELFESKQLSALQSKTVSRDFIDEEDNESIGRKR